MNSILDDLDTLESQIEARDEKIGEYDGAKESLASILRSEGKTVPTTIVQFPGVFTELLSTIAPTCVFHCMDGDMSATGGDL